MLENKSVVRLEQALQVWENLCFLPEMVLRYGNEEMKKFYNFGLSGPIVNHGKLRMALLKTSEDFVLDDFIGELGVSKYLNEVTLLPISLFLWSRLSRRVFQFSPDLQTLLSTISLERVTWDMVNLPLASFVITFPEPMVDGFGWRTDCVLFADATELMKKYREIEKDKKVLHFSLFSTNLNKVRPISFDDKNSMRKNISRQHFGKFGRIARNYFKEGSAKPTDDHYVRAGFVEVFLGKEDPVLGTFERFIATEDMTEDSYQMHSVVDKALHQMVAFCLYLDSLRPAEKKSSIEEVKLPGGKKKAENPKAITDISEIFTVKCEHFISNEEKSVIDEIKKLRKEGSTKCVHWRRGFCRRMPGKGNDPDAPKIVIVKPTLVNAKLLKPDTLPSGSKAILT
jgi:hypothetical protein